MLAELNEADSVDREQALSDASFVKAPHRERGYRPEAHRAQPIGQQAPRYNGCLRHPQAATVTAANVNEVTRVFRVLASLAPVGGNPSSQRHKLERLPGDRGYDSESMQKRLCWLGIIPVLAARSTKSGSGLGVLRWLGERTISWLHQFCRLRGHLDRQTELRNAIL